MHTGTYFCCKCCDGYGAVHCCGQCCVGTELGQGVVQTLDCGHPCVRGVQRHDKSPVKKTRVKGHRYLDEEALEVPAGGVGKWSCCGAGCRVRSCRDQHRSESPAHHPHTSPALSHTTSPNTTPSPTRAAFHRAADALYDEAIRSNTLPSSATTPMTMPAAATTQQRFYDYPTGSTPKVKTAVASYAVTPNSSSLCEECVTAEATTWCSNCEALYCAAHYRSAHASRSGARHIAIAVNYTPSLCVEHPHTRALLHCVTCEVDICRLCCCKATGTGHHTAHHVVTLGEAEDAAVAALKQKIATTEDTKRGVDWMLKDVTTRKRRSQDAAEVARRSVNETFSTLTAALFRGLEQRKAALLEDIDAGVTGITELLTAESGLSRASQSCKEAIGTAEAVLVSNRALKIKGNLLRMLDAADEGAARLKSSTTDATAVLLEANLQDPTLLSDQLLAVIAQIGSVTSSVIPADGSGYVQTSTSRGVSLATTATPPKEQIEMEQRSSPASPTEAERSLNESPQRPSPPAAASPKEKKETEKEKTSPRSKTPTPSPGKTAPTPTPTPPPATPEKDLKAPKAETIEVKEEEGVPPTEETAGGASPTVVSEVEVEKEKKNLEVEVFWCALCEYENSEITCELCGTECDTQSPEKGKE